MFLQQKSTNYRNIEWIIQLLHFLRLHQLVYQFTLVTIILFFVPTIAFFHLFSSLLMILLITPSFLLMQDVLGKKDDEKYGQKRVLFSDQANKLFFISSILIMVIILITNSLLSLICYILLFISTLGYAATKFLRKMYLSYTFRSLSSVFTFLLYLFLFVNILTLQFIVLVSIVTILDLIGNIAGDIRDSGKDSVAGVKTFVTTKGSEYTLQIMCLFMLVIFGLLILQYQSILFVLLLFMNIIPFLLIEQLSIRLAHGIFHLTKLINYLIISFVLSNISILLFLVISVCIVSAWTFSYYFYLYNAKMTPILVQNKNKVDPKQILSI